MSLAATGQIIARPTTSMSSTPAPSIMWDKVEHADLIEGIEVGHGREQILHLLFADNTFLFSSTEPDKYFTLRVMLYLLQAVTCLKINREKCEVVGVNIKEEQKTKVQRVKTGGVLYRRWKPNCKGVKEGCYRRVADGCSLDQCCKPSSLLLDGDWIGPDGSTIRRRCHPVTQMWSKPVMKGIPPSPRDSHTCTTVESKLFVFGGTDGKNPLKDLYVLDTSSNTWLLPIMHGKGPDAREGHGAALVGKRLFIFGGCGKSENNSEEVYYDDLYILDTDNFAWSIGVTSGIPPSARDSHGFCSWRNKLFVVGGEDASDNYLSDVFMLDTDTMSWREMNTSGQKLPPRAGHTTVALGKHLCVFGGFTDNRDLYDDLHVLNTDTGLWIRVTDINQGPSPRFSSAGDCVNLRSGILVLIGGCNAKLLALADMYYLHTGIQADGEANGGREKQLKRKCQETRYENDDMHNIGMLSGSSQHGGVLHSLNPTEDKTFEARVLGRVHDGYKVETIINGQLLRGILFSNSKSHHDKHYHVKKNKHMMMAMNSDDRLNDECLKLRATKDNNQEEGTAQPFIPQVPPRDKLPDCPNGLTGEVACKDPAAATGANSRLPSKEPSFRDDGKLINVQ